MTKLTVLSFWKHAVSLPCIIPHCSISLFTFPFILVSGGTGFWSFILPADVRDTEQFVFSLNNISLYGVIHSFISKRYLCGEVSQTPTLAHLSPLTSRLISISSLKWFSFILVLIHFPFRCHWLYVEARLVLLHSLLLCGKNVKKICCNKNHNLHFNHKLKQKMTVH